MNPTNLMNPTNPDYRYMTPWQYAQIRLRALLRSPSARLEFLAVTAMFLLMFGPSLLTWWRRWMLPTGLQSYAVLILPLTLVWLYLNRYRVVLPELDSLNERFTETSVIRFLMEEEIEEPKRLRWPLVLSVLFVPFALWTGDPMLTCLAFVLLLVSVIGYRLGTFALRTLAFPLSMLAFMTPVPGVLLDALMKRVQPALFRLVVNVLSTFGVEAEVTTDGNPIQIPPDKPQMYELYAGQTGLGFAEAGIFLLLAAWYLSLFQGRFGAKLRLWLCGLVWIGLLLIVRLAALGALGGVLSTSLDGRETMQILATLTRWLLPIVGMAGLLGLMRLLKIRDFQEWVTK
jgi:hypothetical protein